MIRPVLRMVGLDVPPRVARPIQRGPIRYYSPTGAAAGALLYAVFNQAPPLGTILAMLATRPPSQQRPSASFDGNEDRLTRVC